MRRIFLGLVLAAAGALAPSAVRADDTATAQGVAENLRIGGMKHFSVGVGCKGGVTTLRGTVASEEQRGLALSIAQQCEGVTDVIDQMEVGTVKPKSAIKQTSAQQPVARKATKAMPTAVAPSMNIPGPGRQGPVAPAAYQQGGAPIPAYVPGAGGGVAPAKYDQPNLPRHAWPAYAAYPNYGAVTYPKQYSPTAWPYIGPFYPYPQVPLGWRKVTLEWDDGWWMLDFKARRH